MRSLIVLSALVACAFATPGFLRGGYAAPGFVQGGYAAPTVYNAVSYAAAPVAVSNQYEAKDTLGQYSYGYSEGLSAKSESRAYDGSVAGAYSYVDGMGEVQNVQYTADSANGFRVAASNLPVAPPALKSAPLVAPTPVVDTPEVMAARAQHLSAVEEVKSRKIETVAPVAAQVAYSAPIAYSAPAVGGFAYSAPALSGYAYSAPVAAPLAVKSFGYSAPVVSGYAYSAPVAAPLAVKNFGYSAPAVSGYAYSAPVAAKTIAYSAPLVSGYAYSAPVAAPVAVKSVAYSAPVAAPVAVKSVAYSAPVATKTIAYSAPLVSGYAYSAPVATPVAVKSVAYSAPLVSGYAYSAPLVSGYAYSAPVASQVAVKSIAYSAPAVSGYAYSAPAVGGYAYSAPAVSGYSYSAPAVSGYAYSAPAVSGYAYSAPSYAVAPVAASVSSQYHAQDELGQYSYGYNDDLSAKTETKSFDGITRGGYSYVDANGLVQKVDYTSDAVNGFRVAATNLPVGPVASRAETVADSAEVMAAKSMHFAAHAQAKERLAMAL